MKIKRKWTYLGAIRKFKILINGNHIKDIGVNKEVELDGPLEVFTIQFRTMKLEKSQTYQLKNEDGLRVEVNVNPLVRIITWLILPLMPISAIMFENSIPFVLSILVVYFFIYYIYLVRNYMTVKFIDRDGEIIIPEIVK